jgi:hypothetical protein
VFSVINWWLFLTISQASQASNKIAQNDNNNDTTNFNNTIYLLVLCICIVIIIVNLPNKILENFDIFYGRMNIFYWGILSLEIFVGINIGIIFGFEKENNNTSDTIENISIDSIIIIEKKKIINISKILQKIKKNREKKRIISNAIKAKINNDSRLKASAQIIIFSIMISIVSFIVCYMFWLGYSHYSNFIWWIYYRQYDNSGGVLFGACVALMIGLLSILVIGENSGLTTIKHFVLRFILWNNKKILWNYDLFSEEAIEVLDKAVELDLLIKQGDSYVFKDEELRKYIAENYLKDCNSDSL